MLSALRRCNGSIDVMTPVAVICIGNRYLPGDDLGPRVFDRLNGSSGAAGIDLIDGGLCGLNLLRSIEGRRRVVFVDAVAGVGRKIVSLDVESAVTQRGNYGHAAGLPYLLRMAPLVCSGPLPEITLIGAEGPLDEQLLAAVAARSLEVAQRGDP